MAVALAGVKQSTVALGKCTHAIVPVSTFSITADFPLEVMPLLFVSSVGLVSTVLSLC